MNEISSDINIIGGGLVGAASALALSDLGFSITVLDKKPNLNNRKNYDDIRTVAISEGTKEFLEKIKVWNEIHPYSQPIKKIKVIDRKVPNSLEFDNLRRNANLGYIVKNTHLLDVFYTKLKLKKNVKIINNIDISNIYYDGEYIITCLSNNKFITASLNIAADGKFSKIRKILKTPYFKKDYNKKALVINFSHNKNHNGVAHEYFYNNGPLAILPMKKENQKHLSSVVWTNSSTNTDSLIKLDNKKIIKALEESIGRDIGNILKINNKQSFALSAHINSKFYENRTVYVGDSAHSYHPIAGQGWNLGMKDVEALFSLTSKYKFLGLNIGDNLFCKEYHNNTYYKAYRLYQVTDKLDSLFKNNSTAINFARLIGLNIIKRTKLIKNAISDFAMGY